VKLEVKNNWMYLTYFFDGEKIDEKKSGTAVLANGDIVAYRVIKERGHYSDHGSPGYAIQHILRATVVFNGKELEVDLKDLDLLSITPDEEEVE